MQVCSTCLAREADTQFADVSNVEAEDMLCIALTASLSTRFAFFAPQGFYEGVGQMVPNFKGIQKAGCLDTKELVTVVRQGVGQSSNKVAQGGSK
jgi:hypothetical protein